MNRNRPEVLVLYASGGGSTALMAELIAAELEDFAEISLQRLEPGRKGPDPENYDAVIAGSAIRYDRWLTQMTAYVESNEQSLQRRSVAFFFSCLSLAGGEDGRKQARTYENRIRNLTSIQPLSIQGFAGTLNYSAIPYWIRIPFRVGMKIKGLKEGDYREPEAIRAWGRRIKAELRRRWENGMDRDRDLRSGKTGAVA
ncbi:MAG: hypothetical protein CMN76_07810 [Spirochaetaceae bacterium]|nr:hypothetical protein [Spirochaetaceae bacterium]